MPRPVSPRPLTIPRVFLVLGLLVGGLPAHADELPSEAQRAADGVRDATERAARHRTAGREDLASLADALADARRRLSEEIDRALAAEREATEAEEGHLEALKHLDRSTATREERRDRLARLADQIAQAETEARAPAIVSMPKTRKTGVRTPAPARKGGAK